MPAKAYSAMSLTRIPSSLWADDHVIMPAALSESYRQALTVRNLLEACCGPSPSDKVLIGGREADVAFSHFAHRFTTSSVRVQFVVLNPGRNFDPTSTDLLSFFHDGRVSILDLPCGSGGGLFGLLCTIAELRLQFSQARLPLDVHVHAADISPAAMEIHGDLLERVKPPLADVGIRLTQEYAEWDAREDYSTSRLMDAWLRRSDGCEAYLVFVSAFGGFAQDHLPVVQTAIRDILVRFHDDRQLLVAWIEPGMKANARWFPKLTELFQRLVRGRGAARGHDVEVKFRWRHPFTAASIQGSVQIISCDRLNRSSARPAAPLRFDTLAARALNASRMIHAPTYAGLRLLLGPASNQAEAFLSFLRGRCRSRKEWRYFGFQLLKEASGARTPEYRNCLTGSPLTYLAESFILAQMSAEPAFQPPTCAYSYLWPSSASDGRNFEYYFHGYQRRTQRAAELLALTARPCGRSG